jgi:hypothetical protein
MSSVPKIVKLKFNGNQVCPDEVEQSGCAKFEMTSNKTGGRWNGELTIYPALFETCHQIVLVLDNPALALGVKLAN